MFRTLFDSLKSRGSRPARRTPRQPKSSRLQLEALDARCLPSTFTVTNLHDTGAGSLREAVTAANANPGADAIDFATTGTIALTSGQLDVTDSLTINGPGAGALTVSGERGSRVFAIAGNPTVVIAGLTVANGWTSDSPGGGISMTGGTLTLDHITLSGNYAVGAPGVFVDYSTTPWVHSVGDGLGGGLYVAGGTVWVNQSTISGNFASGGGGATELFYGGDGGEGLGGGLYVAGGTVYVNQSTVAGNYARGGAGGDGLQYNSTDSTVGGNGGAAAGGGIRVAAGTVEFYQSSLSGNTAEGGPGGLGIYNGGSFYGTPGVGVGGGLSIASADPPLADLDTFTVANTINNFADIDPNISGPYSLNGTPVPTLAICDVSAAEGNTGATAFIFTVTLSAASTETITVAYATADSTATAGSDYAAASGTLTFAPGETDKTITIDVIGDRLPEANETFFVNLSGPTNAAIGDGQGVGTIVDDEPRIRISDMTMKEGNSGTTAFAFTVSLSVAYDVPVTVAYTTANGTAMASSDYQAASGTLTFAPGETSKTITVLVNGDRLAEPNETFFVNLSSPTNATIADGQAVGTIVDDEPRIRIGDVTKAEGKKNQTTLFTLTITLSAAYDQPVTMSYRTVDGTATTSDSDYVAKTGTLTFAPGETTKTITIEVKGDSKREADETFAVELFGASGNASLLDAVGLGTILNDD